MDPNTIILGTAGHIDHGKTTLVKALTGTDTDRLKEEKERGITIELGFAHLNLPSGRRLGVVDVPGHERFVKNMVAGAMGMDLVILVVAADEGVMPQTKEHLEICQLLGVKSGIVVLTKKDMVDEEWLELVSDDVRGFLAGTFLEGAPVVAVSSTTGEGLDRLLEILDRCAGQVVPRRPVGPYRLPVDRVFVIKGFGTVVTGTSISGKIGVGEEVTIYPPGIGAKVRGIQVHGQESQEARPGMRTALNLQGVSKDDVRRGDVIASPGSLRPSYLLDLELTYLQSAERPLKYRSPVRFHAGTTEVIGRILLRGDELLPGSSSYVQIKLEEPVAVLPGDRYVVRSYSPIRTIGGGRVLHPLPRKRKRTRQDLWDEMDVLANGSPAELLEYHLARAGVRGLGAPELSMRTGIYGKAFKREIDHLLGSRKAVRFEADGPIIHGRVYEGLKEDILGILEAYHRDNPLVQGLSKEELRSRLFPSLTGARRPVQPMSQQAGKANQKLFQRLLQDLSRDGLLVQEQDIVRLSSHKVLLKDEESDIRHRLEELFRSAGLQPPSRKEAVTKAARGGDSRTADDVFELMVRDGSLIRVREGLYYHPRVLEDLKQTVIGFLEEHGEMLITDFRDLSGGLSRKYMIPILEYLDNQRITIRVGDRRKLRGA